MRKFSTQLKWSLMSLNLLLSVLTGHITKTLKRLCIGAWNSFNSFNRGWFLLNKEHWLSLKWYSVIKTFYNLRASNYTCIKPQRKWREEWDTIKQRRKVKNKHHTKLILQQYILDLQHSKVTLGIYCFATRLQLLNNANPTLTAILKWKSTKEHIEYFWLGDVQCKHNPTWQGSSENPVVVSWWSNASLGYSGQYHPSSFHPPAQP